MFKNKKNPIFVVSLLVSVLILLVALFVAGCTQQQKTNKKAENNTTKQERKDLVIYSGRKLPLILPAVEAFEKKFGIKVLMKSGKSAEMVNTIIEERANPQADIVILTDAGNLQKLSEEELLIPYTSEQTQKIPAKYRSPKNDWVGVSGRARVIMYNTDLLKPEELPKTFLELTDSKWKNKIAAPSSLEASWIAQISALRIIKGEKVAEEFLTGLKRNNLKVMESHTQVRKAVGNGEVALGLVNHYYYHLQKAEGSPVGVIYPDQGVEDMGLLVNTAGVGIVKGAKNLEAAKKFIDFLLDKEAQNIFADANFEYPLLPEVKALPEVKSLEGLKIAEIELSSLGKEIDATLKLFDKVGLQ